MARELYKIIHKKYYIAMIFLLLLPALFGAGYFFDLPYIMEGDEIAGSAFDYCAQMQQLIKYFYFFVVIFLAVDAFSGEIEAGQLRTIMVHESSRKRIVMQKYSSLCLVVAIFQALFWAFNIVVYCLYNMKNHQEIVIADKNIIVYAGIFLGYLEAFFVCVAIAFLAGLFLRKLYCLVLVYFMWFILRYADQVAGMKGIATEFMADYLIDSPNALLLENILCYLTSLFLCAAAVYTATCFYQYKDIN